MDGWDFQADYATTSLVANQEEYVFPTNILKIKRIEVTYDGTNWNDVSFLDINEIGRATDSTTKANEFSTSKPYADVMDSSLFLYPTPTSAVTAGLKIWYEKEITELSADTDEPVILEAYQEGLALGAAKEYLIRYIDQEGNRTRLAETKVDLSKIVEDMQSFYRSRVQDQNYEVMPVYEDYGYGDNDGN